MCCSQQLVRLGAAQLGTHNWLFSDLVYQGGQTHGVISMENAAECTKNDRTKCFPLLSAFITVFVRQWHGALFISKGSGNSRRVSCRADDCHVVRNIMTIFTMLVEHVVGFQLGRPYSHLRRWERWAMITAAVNAVQSVLVQRNIESSWCVSNLHPFDGILPFTREQEQRENKEIIKEEKIMDTYVHWIRDCCFSFPLY